jgi:hypothetical protein
MANVRRRQNLHQSTWYNETLYYDRSLKYEQILISLFCKKEKYNLGARLEVKIYIFYKLLYLDK